MECRARDGSTNCLFRLLRWEEMAGISGARIDIDVDGESGMLPRPMITLFCDISSFFCALEQSGIPWRF